MEKESFLQSALTLHYVSFPNSLLTLLLLHTVVAPFCNHPPIYYTIFHLLPCLQHKKNQLPLVGENNVLFKAMASFKTNSSNDECNSSNDFRGVLAQQKLLTAPSFCSEIINLSFKCKWNIFSISFPSRVLMNITVVSQSYGLRSMVVLQLQYLPNYTMAYPRQHNFNAHFNHLTFCNNHSLCNTVF